MFQIVLSQTAGRDDLIVDDDVSPGFRRGRLLISPHSVYFLVLIAVGDLPFSYFNVRNSIDMSVSVIVVSRYARTVPRIPSRRRM